MSAPRRPRVTTIIDAARDLFAQKGFEATTLDDIAARAKVSKGLAYHYFRSKDEILRELIRARLDELDSLVARLRSEASAPDRLRILVEQLVAELEQTGDRQRFLVTTFLQKQHHRLVTRAMQESPERFNVLFAEELRLLKDLGYGEAERELPLFRAGLQGMVLLYLLDPSGFPLRATADLFMARYLSGGTPA